LNSAVRTLFQTLLSTSINYLRFASNEYGRFRDECLNEHCLSDISHARKTISEWRQDYKESRPHSLLNYQTPSEFAAGWRKGNYDSEGAVITD